MLGGWLLPNMNLYHKCGALKVCCALIFLGLRFDLPYDAREHSVRSVTALRFARWVLLDRHYLRLVLSLMDARCTRYQKIRIDKMGER